MKCRHCKQAVGADGTGRFCSQRCRRDWMSDLGKRRSPRTPARPVAVTKTCEGCGQSFEVIKHAARRRFCGDRCYEQHVYASVKGQARLAVQQAVKAGRLDKPEACEDCGKERPLHGHHEDYGHPLEVVWVCRPCHAARHRQQAA